MVQQVTSFFLTLELRHAIIAFLLFIMVQTVLAIRHDLVFRAAFTKLNERLTKELGALSEEIQRLKERVGEEP